MSNFIYKRHLPFIHSLIVIATLLFTTVCSFGQANNRPKPLSPFTCESGAKIVFEVYPVENPYVRNISTYTVDWNKINTGMAIGGFTGGFFGSLAGGLDAAEGAIEVDDQTQEFRNAVTPVFKNSDLDMMLLAALERNIKPKTFYPTIYLPTSNRPDTLVQPSDRFIKMSLFLIFQGGRPCINARFSVALITKSVDINKLNIALDTLWKLSQEIHQDTMNRNIIKQVAKDLKGLNKVTRFIRLAKKFQIFIESNKTFLANSQRHSTEEWLANDGALVKQELEALINQMATELANIIFQPELALDLKFPTLAQFEVYA